MDAQPVICPIRSVRFQVFGLPQTKGSTEAFMRPGMRFPIITNDNPKNKDWARTVSAMAQVHRPQDAPWLGPLRLRLTFVLRKPKKPKALLPITRPDLDKLTRSIKDALTGVIYQDDSQIVSSQQSKRYGDAPGVEVIVRKL